MLDHIYIFVFKFNKMNPFNDNHFMKQAFIEAQNAFDEGEVPVGAVVVANNQIIARGHNQTERLQDFTAHAEMIAVTSASNFIGNKYLDQCTLYVTLEPCSMCASALQWCKIKKVVFGAFDEKRGASQYQPKLYHPKTEVVGGIMEKESLALLHDFFERRRKENKTHLN